MVWEWFEPIIFVLQVIHDVILNVIPWKIHILKLNMCFFWKRIHAYTKQFLGSTLIFRGTCMILPFLGDLGFRGMEDIFHSLCQITCGGPS